MSIIKLEEKYKSRNTIQLHPRRRFVSSSSGITGSLFVFPNRSETQKDNIDERLALFPLVDSGDSNWDGSTPDRADIIRPHNGNSLEARRKEIYEGNFSKLTVSPFSDATQYEYAYIDTVDGSRNDIYTGEDLNDLIFQDQANPIVPTVQNPPVVTAVRQNDGRIYEWSSAGYWRSQNSTDIFHRLPINDRDRGSKNFEVPLALLLDGANPYTREHAWRYEAKKNGELADLYELYQNDPTNPDYANYAQYQTYYDQGWRSGNSSYTNTPNPELYQFSGNSVVYDSFGNPFVGAPISTKEELNVWPPEIDKWDIAVNTNWMLQGYSDLSMHPRNKTQKNIKLSKGTGDHFSKTMAIQRQLFNRMKNIEIEQPFWSVRNYNALSLSSYEDANGNTKSPCLAYRNLNNRYHIDWDATNGSTDAVTFEFWIKPTKEQTGPGTICHLPSNHAIVLLPFENSLANGVYHRYKIGVYVQNAAAVSNSPKTDDVTTSGAGNSGIYVTDALIELDNWHHVAIRWSENFNNGLLSVYVDGILESSNTEDGIYAGSRTGLVNTSLQVTTTYTYTIGGWQGVSFTNLFGSYAAEQKLQTLTVPPSFATGYNIDPTFQLKSELTEFRVWNVAKTNLEINNTMKKGLDSTENLKCYIPFQFNPSSDTPQISRNVWVPDSTKENLKSYYKNATIVKVGGSTGFNPSIKVPFCSNNGYIGGIPIVYVHSYVEDIVNNQYPVITSLIDFSSSSAFPDEDEVIDDLGELIHVRESWQSSSALRTLNSLIVPCDNGKFVPDFELNRSEFNIEYRPENIYLAGPGVGSVETDLEIARFLDDETFVVDDIIQMDPDAFGQEGPESSTMQQYRTNIIASSLRSEDFISPVSTVIEIPQLYYGNSIKEGSIVLKFTHNKDGKMITLKDFRGSLYRMNSTSRKKVCKVGMVDYHNGVICIFHPLLASLGIDDFDLSFSGFKNMHVLQLDVPCSSGVANLSANKGYKKLKASSNANETDGNITYISSIYLHDSNLNIIGKVNLAQPTVKREEDSFIFRVKLDF